MSPDEPTTSDPHAEDVDDEFVLDENDDDADAVDDEDDDDDDADEFGDRRLGEQDGDLRSGFIAIVGRGFTLDAHLVEIVDVQVGAAGTDGFGPAARVQVRVSN